jgi:hypothetical protein
MPQVRSLGLHAGILVHEAYDGFIAGPQITARGDALARTNLKHYTGTSPLHRRLTLKPLIRRILCIEDPADLYVTLC